MKRYSNRIGFNIITCEDELKTIEDPDGQWVPASVAQALYDALIETRKIICEGVETGFNPHDGDWAETLFLNNANIAHALSLADGEDNE